MMATGNGSTANHPAKRGHNVLVCLDRSPFSEACLPYAVSLANTFGSTVTLLHVMQPRSEHPGPQTTLALGWEISRQEAQGYLERLEKEASAALGRSVEVRLEQGRPAERIVDVAREIGADLIVLASHGEGGVTETLGSTAQQVLAAVRGSLLIVHSSSTTPRMGVLKRILVPLDGSLRTESVLPIVARIADACGAEILLAHIVEEPVQTEVLRAPEDLKLAHELATRLEASAKLYLEGLRDQVPRDVASVRTLVVRHPNERQCLLEIAKRERIDLVVLSAHGAACDPARSFGSVTAHLATHGMVPILVLQDVPECEQHRNEDTDDAPPLRASFPPGAV